MTFAARWITRASLIAGIGIASACNGAADGADDDDTTVTIRHTTVSVEVMRTREEQALGLGSRDSLAWGRGMLFVYDRPDFFTFWMKRMRFDIDIVWIRDGRVVAVSHRVPHPPNPEGAPATVRAPELVDRVLEVPAGFAQAHGWTRNDVVEIASP